MVLMTRVGPSAERRDPNLELGPAVQERALDQEVHARAMHADDIAHRFRADDDRIATGDRDLFQRAVRGFDVVEVLAVRATTRRPALLGTSWRVSLPSGLTIHTPNTYPVFPLEDT